MHHVIYIPGLGDHKTQGQRLAPRFWEMFGVKGHYIPIHWNDKQPFAPKLRRLLDKIDELSADGSYVSLVGTSAGASVVLIALAQRPDTVTGVVCICGKINHPETIRPERYVENPAFEESLTGLQRVLPELSSKYASRIMSIHPLYDGTVPVRDTIIPGAHEKTVPMVGHVFSILMVLVFGAYSIMLFLKSRAVR